MFSFAWTATWWNSAFTDFLSFVSIVHSFLFEWIILLMILLLVYYFVTLRKRHLLQTVLGIPCALFLAFLHFTAYPGIYENTADRIIHSSLRFQPATESALFLSYLAAIPIALTVLAAIVLCIVNLIRRRVFSAKQILWLTLPIWVALALYLIAWLCNGGSANPLIGYPELLLALMLTLTLTGKDQPFLSNFKKESLPSPNEADTEAKE